MDESDFGEVITATRDFITREVIPREAEIEETDDVPAVLREQAAAMGLFGYALPVQHGGLGLSARQDVELALELGRTTPAFRSIFGTNNGIAGQVIVNFGTHEQKQRYLPALASGERLASFALTEDGAGSDPSALATTARRDGEGYVLNGHKRFITNARRADWLVVFARTGHEASGTRGISAFVVDATAAGVTIGAHDEKMGQRGTTTSDVILDDVRVDASALVGEVEGEGFAAAMRSLAKGRLHISAICVGMASRLLEESVAHAATGTQGGRPIAEFQLVQAMLAESQTDLYAGRSMVLDAANRYDDGSDRRLAPSCAKLFCSEMVGRVADRAVQIHGGSGYIRGVAAERFFRDARLFRIYEGTSEVQKLIIAKRLLAGARA